MPQARRFGAIVLPCVVVFAAALVAGAQTPPATGSVRGTTTDAAGGAVSGIVVVLFPSDEARWSGSESVARLKRADVADGRFSFSDVPAGPYRIAFVTEPMLADWPSAGTIGRLNTRRPVPVSIEPGEQIGIDAIVTVTGTDVAVGGVRMSRGTTTVQRVPSGAPGALPPGRGQPPGVAPRPTATGAITGRVTDADGKPIAGLEVRAMRPVASSSGLQLATFGLTATTDADGRYQLLNRSPGEYVVAVPAFAIDVRTGGTQWLAPAPAPGPDGALMGYVTTYHGGGTDPRAATSVVVAGDERSGIDVQLIRRRVYDVTGSITGLPLSSASLAVTISPVQVGELVVALNAFRARVSDRGGFVIAGVPDGEYQISFSTPTGWAQERVRVAGRSPDAVTMTLRAPMIVTGRVEFQGSSPVPQNIPVTPQYLVELAPAQLTPGVSYSRFPIGQGNSFTARGTGPGPFRLRATMPSPWFQIAGFVGGVDTLDIPAPASADTDSGLIIFSDRQSALLVKVTDDADRPVADVGVIVFSEDSRYWSARSRRVQLASTFVSGAATISNVPPGKYFVLAGRDVDVNGAISPALIERLKPRALPFELTAGESRSLQVRVR